MFDLDFDVTRFYQWQYRHNSKSRRSLFEMLATMLENGVPIDESLRELKRVRTILSSEKHIEVIAYSDWLEQIGRGRKLSSSVEGWLPDDERILLSAGEKSGKLPETLRSIIKIVDAKMQIRKTIVGALAYPIILLMVILGLVYAFAFYAIPFYQSIVPGANFTGLAGLMVTASSALRDYFFIGLSAIIVFLTAFIYSLKNWVNGPIRKYLDKNVLPYKIYRIINGSAWLTSFSALLSAGVPIMDALNHTSQTESNWLKARIETISSNLRDTTLGAAMSKSGYDFPDVEIIGQISIFSKYASFDTALKAISEKWIDNSLETIKLKMKVINVSLILMVIGVVLLITLSQVDISNQIQTNLKNSMS